MSEEQAVDTPVEETTDTVEQSFDILTDEGKFNEQWRDSLPDDLGKHSIFNKYDNPLDLVKGSINAQNQIGKKAEEFWFSEDANDISKRNEIMGVPSSKDEYKFEDREYPEGTELDEEAIGSFKEFAHQIGLSQKQAQSLLDYQIEADEKQFAEDDKLTELSLREAEESLREEWTGDKFEYNMGKVANVMDFLGLEEFKDDPMIGNNVEFIKAIFENVVPLISEDDIIESGVEQNYATINDQLQELEYNMMNYDGDTNDYKYKSMVKERLALLEKIT